jgi:hypothetical protein
VYEVLIPALATAARIASVRVASSRIKAISDGIEQLTGIPGRPDWEHKAARHAAIFGLLADAVDDAAAASVLRLGITVLGDLAVMAGPVADGMITSWHRRLLGHLRAADPDAAEHEMESLLWSLHDMWRLARLPGSTREFAGGALPARGCQAALASWPTRW